MFSEVGKSQITLAKSNEFGFPPSDVNFNQMKGLSLESPYGYLKFFVFSFGSLQKVKP